MKFTANRRIFLEYLKSMQRLVARNSPIPKLKGFLIEANGDDGFLYMTATNQESAVQRKFKTDVETCGSFVMEAKILINILSLLGGDEVCVTLVKLGVAEIRSESCIYTIHVTDGKTFPRPEFPFPEDTVSVCNIKQFYARTGAIVGGSSVVDSLKGIRFDIQMNGMRVISCNARSVAVASKEFPCGGSLAFTLSKETVSHLASVAGDEELEVGLCGSSVVFMKDNMLFSSKILPHEYVDVDFLFNSFHSDYLAKLEFEEFQSRLFHVCDIAALGSEASYVHMTFGESAIVMATRNDVGGAESQAEAVQIEGSGGHGYYYSAAQLKDIFKTVEGTLLVSVDKNGYLIVYDKYNKFMMTPMAAHAVERQVKRFEEGRNKSKNGSKTNKKAA